jgi:surface protein
MLRSFVAIVLFVVVIVVVDTIFFLFIQFIAASSLHFVVLPAVVCVVFYSSAFNSDISAWNTGAVTSMAASKSSIDRCFFCGSCFVCCCWSCVDHFFYLFIISTIDILFSKIPPPSIFQQCLQTNVVRWAMVSCILFVFRINWTTWLLPSR